MLARPRVELRDFYRWGEERATWVIKRCVNLSDAGLGCMLRKLAVFFL